MNGMVTMKTNGLHHANRFWEHPGVHYISFEDDIETGLHKTNNVISDAIPDNGVSEAWYWYSFENLQIITNAITLKSTKARGTDHDFAQFGEYVRWGQARQHKQRVFQQGVDFVNAGQGLPSDQDIYYSTNVFLISFSQTCLAYSTRLCFALVEA